MTGEETGPLWSRQVPRRAFLGAATLGGAAVLGAGCGGTSKKEREAKLVPPNHPDLIRVSTVYTPYSSGLLPALARSFEEASTISLSNPAQVSMTKDFYGHAATITLRDPYANSGPNLNGYETVFSADVILAYSACFVTFDVY